MPLNGPFTVRGALALLTISAISPSLVAQDRDVRFEILEGIPDKRSWDYSSPTKTGEFREPAFALAGLPTKYSPKGIRIDRSSPFLIRATAAVELPAAEYRVLLRAHGAAQLFLDDKLVGETPFIKPNANGHEEVPPTPEVIAADLRPLPVGHSEKLVTLTLDGQPHRWRLDAIIGGQKLRPEVGELSVSIAMPKDSFRLLSPTAEIPHVDDAWSVYAAASAARMVDRSREARHAIADDEVNYWTARHELARREWSDRLARVPSAATDAPAQNVVDRFIGERIREAGVTAAPICDDWTFLRRVTLDTIGVVPSRAEIAQFMADDRTDRRNRAIDRLLADPRWADHWVGYWQDVLAENPGILKPQLNNTGPFRWWIYESFLDNKPMDQFATELVLMEGSVLGGGPAGFSMASMNDAPMASKAHIAARAFLGIEMQCARCHDAPFHPFKQESLFSLAAMLSNAPVTVPTTSTVKLSERTRRPLIEVTLEPGKPVAPAWLLDEIASPDLPAGVLRDPKHSRERFAAILTSPRNERFAQVLVNRLWKRYFGRGLVEPVDDWDSVGPSHPELLRYLARELVMHDYDLKHVARLLLASHAYQRTTGGSGAAEAAAAAAATAKAPHLFQAAIRRRLTAEQLIDSLTLVTGKQLDAEELNLDVDGRRPITEFLNLGTPRRAWQLTSLSNERDRPALSLPIAQGIVDLLTTFGWRESRQSPITERDTLATPLQPMTLANGVAAQRAVRLSDDGSIVDLCLESDSVVELVDEVFVQVLSRPPLDTERQALVEMLFVGFESRRVPGAIRGTPTRRTSASAVSWSNHLHPDATRLKLELERAARDGEPPTQRLTRDWRERMEDVVWCLVNTPEFVFVP